MSRRKVEVVLPRPAQQAAAWQGDATLYDPSGKSIGVLENGWGSSKDLAKALERILRAEYGVLDVVHFSNPREDEAGNKSSAVPPEFLEGIVAVADYVVTGLGN